MNAAHKLTPCQKLATALCVASDSRKYTLTRARAHIHTHTHTHVTHQNVQSSLATTLHEVSVSFRKDQKKYLEKLRDNEAKSRYKPTLNHTEEEFEDTGLSQEQMAEYMSFYCYTLVLILLYMLPRTSMCTRTCVQVFHRH